MGDPASQLPDRLHLLSLAKLFFQTLALGLLFGFAQGSNDRGDEASGLGFQDVIGRPVLQGSDRVFFAQRTREEDERYLGALGLRREQGGMAVVGRERIIGDDHVETAFLQRSHERIAGLHTIDLEGQAFRGEHGLNELGVLRIVFKMQNPHR